MVLISPQTAVKLLVRKVIKNVKYTELNQANMQTGWIKFPEDSTHIASESTLLRTSSDRHAFLVPRPQILSQNSSEMRRSNAAQEHHTIHPCAQHNRHKKNIV
jgi:hypothetical protein